MAWARVRSSSEATLGTGAGNGGTSQSLSLTGANAPSAGHTLVCYISTWRASNLDSGILTVTGGGTWSNLISAAPSSAKNRAQISFCASATGGNTTVTVTSANSCDIAFFVTEWSGGNTPTAGVTSSGFGTTVTSVDSGTTANATAGDLVLGVYSDDGENPGTITQSGTASTLDQSFPSASIPSIAASYNLSAAGGAGVNAHYAMGTVNNPVAVVGTLHVGAGAAASPIIIPVIRLQAVNRASLF